ncbi:GNAT family N-acetyltransferase [Lysinibacillus piscis]|uniref:Acetyltransferase n=1 Tax=Lysinibacillus piscis TaxID=2518931 RepID=A0ABQ5NM50_9BACI|nr:GNAT family N-acetyltransferase [Lysinibacillus sp. KH24]GLC89425.1 acetyltransferase [Lysinibacillus sp. KH24]
MTWKIQTYDDLTKNELYRILQLREKVFIVEQQCYYEDLDNHDQQALHLSYVKEDKLVAYARILPPGEKVEMASFGRVIISPEARGTGLGKELVQLAIDTIEKEWSNQKIFIEAQAYLLDFYRAFGFQQVSDVYDYDGIPHIDMLYEG